MVKLVASDLDGTLLDDKGRLPQGIFERIRALRERGVWFAAASGRQYDNLKRLFAPVWREMAFVCENGGLVTVQDCREARYFPRAQAEEIIRDILGCGMELLISTPDTCCMLTSASRAFTDDIFYRLRNTCALIEDPFAMADGYIKLSGFCPHGVARLAPALQEKWRGRVNADIAGRCWLDFTLANKRTGLEKLYRQLRIPLDQMAAFGDQFNDVSMLQAVGRPYLMCSAPEELRKMGFSPCQSVLNTLDALLREIA